MVSGKSGAQPVSFSHRSLSPALIVSGQHRGPDFPPPLRKGRRFSSYHSLVDFLAARILDESRRTKRRMVVNITGGTNAGKSTLTEKLREQLAAAGKDVVHFSEDFALHSSEQIGGWRRSGDPRFEDPWKYWFRWKVIEDFFAGFRDAETALIHCDGLYNKRGGGRLTHALDLRLGARSILLYDGVFTFDRRCYPFDFDFSVFLHVRFEEAMRRSIAKGGDEKAVRERWEKCFVPSQLAYREELHPERAADVVVDLNVFNKPQMLIYRS